MRQMKNSHRPGRVKNISTTSSGSCSACLGTAPGTKCVCACETTIPANYSTWAADHGYRICTVDIFTNALFDPSVVKNYNIFIESAVLNMAPTACFASDFHAMSFIDFLGCGGDPDCAGPPTDQGFQRCYPLDPLSGTGAGHN